METIYFKIEKNDVYLQGYVEINDELAEDVDYYFFDQTGMTQSRPFYHCDEAVTGLTDELNDRIDDFENDYLENVGEIWDIILQCSEDEHNVYHRFGFTITVGDD